MEVITYIRKLKVSPKKLRFLLPDIKKMKPYQALSVLRYTPKKSARIIYKAINSAIINAKSALKVTDDLLKFKVLTVDEGLRQKRWRPGGRGTPSPFKRKSAHVKIILEAELPIPEKRVEPQKKESQQEVKKDMTKPETKQISKRNPPAGGQIAKPRIKSKTK